MTIKYYSDGIKIGENNVQGGFKWDIHPDELLVQEAVDKRKRTVESDQDSTVTVDLEIFVKIVKRLYPESF